MKYLIGRSPLLAVCSVLALTLVSGCLPPNESMSGGDGTNVITQEEIAETAPDGSALDLIEALRPNWLNAQRGTRNLTPGQGFTPALPTFYLDDMERSHDEMQNVRATQVQRIVFLPPEEANIRYGSGNQNGAILVVTK